MKFINQCSLQLKFKQNMYIYIYMFQNSEPVAKKYIKNFRLRMELVNLGIETRFFFYFNLSYTMYSGGATSETLCYQNLIQD